MFIFFNFSLMIEYIILYKTKIHSLYASEMLKCFICMCLCVYKCVMICVWWPVCMFECVCSFVWLQVLVCLWHIVWRSGQSQVLLETESLDGFLLQTAGWLATRLLVLLVSASRLAQEHWDYRHALPHALLYMRSNSVNSGSYLCIAICPATSDFLSKDYQTLIYGKMYKVGPLRQQKLLKNCYYVEKLNIVPSYLRNCKTK